MQSKDWEKLDDMRMYPGDPNATKTMNANFHIMVAYANIYREYKDNKVKKALKNLIEVLINKVIDKERGSCRLNFKDNWEVVPSNDNYGLDIEATWLIWDAVQVLGDENLKQRVKPIILKMVDHCLKYGYDKDGGMFSSGSHSCSRKTTFSYDSNGNLIRQQEKYYVSIPDLNISIEGLNTDLGTVLTTFKYEYDSNGNWISKETYVNGVLQSLMTREITYWD